MGGGEGGSQYNMVPPLPSFVFASVLLFIQPAKVSRLPCELVDKTAHPSKQIFFLNIYISKVSPDFFHISIFQYTLLRSRVTFFTK